MRKSEYNFDGEAALTSLWHELDIRGIHPFSSQPLMGMHLLDLVVESVSEPSVGRALFAADLLFEVYF